jgi:predicted Zn-dependent peptidase
MEDIEAATLEDVADFFGIYYVPNNAVLTVCGDFTRDDAIKLIERHFMDIPRGADIPPIPGDTELSATIGSTVRECVEAEVPLPRVLMAFRIPPYSDPSFYAADVASAVLGTGRASRLYRSLVRERREAKDVTSMAFPLTSGAGMLILWATGFPGADPEALEAALSREVEALGTVRDEEIDRAVALTETAWVREIEQVGQRADLLSMFDQLFDDPGRINSEIERMRDVSPKDVAAFSEDFLGTNNRAVLTYVPADSGVVAGGSP